MLTCIFPPEVLSQFINDGRTLRRFRQTCRALSTLTVSGRWDINVIVDYDNHYYRPWLIGYKGPTHCQMQRWVAAHSVTIVAGDAMSVWYPVYADTLAGIYSACLAREYLLTGADLVIPYRSYFHDFPTEDWYVPNGIKITLSECFDCCQLQINPADFSHDIIESYFTLAHDDDRAVYDGVHVTLLAPASVVYAYFGPSDAPARLFCRQTQKSAPIRRNRGRFSKFPTSAGDQNS